MIIFEVLIMSVLSFIFYLLSIEFYSYYFCTAKETTFEINC